MKRSDLWAFKNDKLRLIAFLAREIGRISLALIALRSFHG